MLLVIDRFNISQKYMFALVCLEYKNWLETELTSVG